MSKSLYWSIIPKEPVEHPCDLKWIMKEFWGEDETFSGSVILDKKHFSFLEGVIAAGSKEVKVEAQDLISAIKIHGEIQITIR